MDGILEKQLRFNWVCCPEVLPTICRKIIKSKKHVLVFNETFDPNWKAYLYEETGNKPLKDSMSGFFTRFSNLFFKANLTGELKEIPTHFVANGYGNGWIIP